MGYTVRKEGNCFHIQIPEGHNYTINGQPVTGEVDPGTDTEAIDLLNEALEVMQESWPEKNIVKCIEDYFIRKQTKP